MHDLVETLDVKLTTSLDILEAKLMEHLQNSRKEAKTEGESLKVYQDLKIKDIS